MIIVFTYTTGSLKRKKYNSLQYNNYFILYINLHYVCNTNEQLCQSKKNNYTNIVILHTHTIVIYYLYSKIRWDKSNNTYQQIILYYNKDTAYVR